MIRPYNEDELKKITKQDKCRHQNLQFVVGGGAIKCNDCDMCYGALGPLGFQRYNYYNVNILSTDQRVDPNKTPRF
jgi:hypothetical protein